MEIWQKVLHNDKIVNNKLNEKIVEKKLNEKVVVKKLI